MLPIRNFLLPATLPVNFGLSLPGSASAVHPFTRKNRVPWVFELAFLLNIKKRRLLTSFLAGVERLEWLRPLVLRGFYLRLRLIQSEHCASPPRCFSHRERFGGSPVHAEKPRALGVRVSFSSQHQKKTPSDVFFGRGRETRTPGTRFWRPLLYQLSYTPSSQRPIISCGILLVKCFPKKIEAKMPLLRLGRGDRIRTCGPLVPNQVRYQAAPRPDAFCIIVLFSPFVKNDRKVFLFSQTLDTP